jgi:DnaJ-domain-containing protein 1
MKLRRRIYFGMIIATIIILFKDTTLPILSQINQTFNLWEWLEGCISQYYELTTDIFYYIVLSAIWLIITIGVTLIITIFKNRILHSLIFSLLFIFYFQEFSTSIISPNQISKLIKGIGISVVENSEIPYLILVIFFTVVFYLFSLLITILKNRILYSVTLSLFFVFYLQNFPTPIISTDKILEFIEEVGIPIGKNVQSHLLILVILSAVVFYLFSLIFTFGKKGEEKVNISKKNKPQLEKTPESQIDFDKERRDTIEAMVLETSKAMNEILQRVYDSSIRENLQLLHSQVNSVSNSYFQSNISFERAVEQLNEIKNDAETLSKEPEETTTGAQVDTGTYEENNYYKILKIAADASPEEIKLAYIKKITKYHPDKVSEKSHNDKIKAQKMCQKINMAYHVLGYQAKRRVYNQKKGLS